MLPQDLEIEVLSYLDLSESNHLAHVNHEWLQASRVERRRSVELTWSMVEKLNKRTTDPSITRATIIASPLSRLITQLPIQGPFKFDHQELITDAHLNFPNLLTMHLILPSPPPAPVEAVGPAAPSEHQLPRPPPLTQIFHLPSRLTDISILVDVFTESMITVEQQQFYLDSLASAPQLQDVQLSWPSPTLNYTVLTQLPQLTDLTIYIFSDFKPAEPIPHHVLPILVSLKQLVRLTLDWTILPHQWSQLHLPLLQHISLDNRAGIHCSTDLVPLMKTIMVKSLRHLRLHLDVGSDVSLLVGLVKFTQLEKLDIYRNEIDELEATLTENDLGHIHTALCQLKSLTSLRLSRIGRIHTNVNDYKMSLSEILEASVHLTALELTDESTIDFSFLCTPLAHQRLVELRIDGVLTRSEMVDGILKCQHLRQLQIGCYPSSSVDIDAGTGAAAGTVGAGASVDWWDEVRLKLDSPSLLPSLNLLTLERRDPDHQSLENIAWCRSTGSWTHPEFRSKRVAAASSLTTVTHDIQSQPASRPN